MENMDIMDNIKEVLVFISFSFSRFFLNFVSHLSYLVLALFLTLVVYFTGFKSFGNHYLFVGYMVLLVVLNYFIRKFLFFRHQLILNLFYVRFLGNRGVLPNTEVPCDLRVTLKQVSQSLKEMGYRFRSHKLLAALTAEVTAGNTMRSPLELKKGKKLILAYFFLQCLVVLLVWLPFALISFLFTMGLSSHLKFLIYLLSFFFVYFLNATIIDPMVALLVQKRITEKK